MILEKLEVGPFATNCYLVGAASNKEGMIIDPGAEAHRILKKVDELKLEVNLIVLTHAHFDHFGAVKEIKEAIGAQVAIHADDAASLLIKHPLMEQYGLSFQLPSPPDRLLKDGDILDIGSLHLLVLHTPGHTPGGICLSGEGIVFSGDTLFNLGIGRTDMPGGSSTQLIDSIHSQLMVLPENTIVYPGHGPSTTIGNERRMNPFLSQ